MDGIGTFLKHYIGGNGVEASSLYSADIDGDNDQDLLSTYNSMWGDKVVWFENTDGNGPLGPPLEIYDYNGLRLFTSVLASDIDSDGDLDVLSTYQYDVTTLIWFENTDGNGNFGNHHIITTQPNNGRISALTSDVDGDADPDIISAYSKKIVYFENTGFGSFGEEQTIAIFNNYVTSILVFDVDIDGDQDIVAYVDQKVIWFENIDGNGAFGSEQVITSDFTCGSALCKTDIENDGDIDIIFACQCEIILFENLTIEIIVPDVEILPDLTSECVITELTPPTATDTVSGTVLIGTTDIILPITKQGNTVITWHFENDNGNIEEQTQMVIIDDITEPEIDNVSLPDIKAECEVNSLTQPTATDNCLGTIFGSHDTVLPINTQGTTLITWRYHDSNGNNIQQTQKIIINDETFPNVLTKDTIIDVAGVSSISINPDQIDNGSSDNCDFLSMSVEPDTFSKSGDYPVLLSVEDKANNVSSAVATVTVIDSSKDDVIIFPNPAKGNVTILTIKKIESINIYNLYGQLIKQTIIKDIDVSGFQKGAYLISVAIEGGKTTTFKLLKY